MTQSKQLSQLLENWDEARARGEEISVENLCRDHPELLPLVKERIEAIKAMEDNFPTLDETRRRLTKP